VVRRKHEEIYPHPNNALENQLESRLFGEPASFFEMNRSAAQAVHRNSESSARFRAFFHVPILPRWF
jgi:hypothetical protein